MVAPRPFAADPAQLPSGIEANAAEGARRFGYYLALALGAFLLVGAAWARFSQIDVIVRGDAKVIASGETSVVEAPHAGVVKAIFVKDGDTVEADQRLMLIDAGPRKAELDGALARRYALMARAARLRAEAEGRDTIDFVEELRQSAAREVEAETAAFAMRSQRLRDAIASIAREAVRREQHLRELKGSVARLEARLRLRRAEEYDACRAYRDGSAALAGCQQAQRASIEAAAQLVRERRGVPLADAALREARQLAENERARFRADALKELERAEAEIAALRPPIAKQGETLEITELRSPVRGVVKRVAAIAIGGIVKAGEALVEIAPAEDSLLVEVRIKPEDVARVRPDQDATVMIDTYESSIFGGIAGKVVAIEPDPVIDEKNGAGGGREIYYRVRVRTEKAYLERNRQTLPVIPGMTGRVDIRTGRRTVLGRVLEPFHRLLSVSPWGGARVATPLSRRG